MKKVVETIVLALAALALSIDVYAQAKTAAPMDPPPQVPDAVKQAITQAQVRAQAYELAKQALQEKQDAALGDLQRAVTAAQQACGKDYALTAQLSCAKNPEPKKEDPAVKK